MGKHPAANMLPPSYMRTASFRLFLFSLLAPLSSIASSLMRRLAGAAAALLVVVVDQPPYKGTEQATE